MEFNLNKYINDRLREINLFLSGINFKDLKSDTAITFTPEQKILDKIFNKSPLYRNITNKFIVSILNSYYVLKDTELEFAESKEEVDDAIKAFADKVNIAIKDFKNNALSIFAKDYNNKLTSNEDAKPINITPSLINSDLSFINFSFYNKTKTGEEINHENNITYLKDIIPCVYTLICMLNDKAKKMNLFTAKFEKLKVGSLEYKAHLKIYAALKQERDYDKFALLYESIEKAAELKSGSCPKAK